MDKKFLSKHFKFIHWDNEGVAHKCSKCGELEHFVGGIKNGTKTRGYYSYPDFKPRSSTICSKCTLEGKQVPKRVTSIYYKNCNQCDSLFVTKTKRSKYCSKKCTHRYHNSLKYKEYELKCEQCGTNFIHNKKKKFCSTECEKLSFRKPKQLISCKTCGNKFEGTKKDIYCSKECSPWVHTSPRSKKCISCDNLVFGKSRKCSECKSKSPKVFKKTCPTCGKEFETKTKVKVYCKSSHSPSSKKKEP